MPKIVSHVLTLLLLGSGVARADSFAITVKPLELQAIKPSQKVPRLEALGAYVLQSSHPDFGAFSGLRLSCSGTMDAVTDTGFWFTGDVVREADGKISAINANSFEPTKSEAGEESLSKWLSDFESLTIDSGFVYLGAEQAVRVVRFTKSDDGKLLQPQRVDGSHPSPDTRQNNGFEALATLPGGGLIVLHERARGTDAPVPGFVLKNGKRTDFQVVRSDNYSVTDADVAGNNLLLLERRVSPVVGSQMRLRRIAIEELMSGKVLEGKIIHQSVRSDPVDNMEGLSVCDTPDGYRLSVISDDNHWPLQRTLFVEFMLKR